MTKKNLLVALLLISHGLAASAQQSSVAVTPAPPVETTGEDFGYTGATTRVGLGYDEKTHLRGDLYRVLTESETSSVLGEAWISGSAGGVKFSYNWLPEPWSVKSADPIVRKFFVAADRNSEGDAKITVGGGFETTKLFGGLYGSAAITGRRPVSDLTQATTQTIQGDDGRPFLQDITTSVRTQVFERAYDYGIGARLGHFYDAALVRLIVGADYEWGSDSARQTTVSLGVEKYFSGAPFSLAFNVEHFRKSGGVELTGSDTRVMAMFRYEFGGPAFRPARESRMVQVQPQVVPQTPPAPVAVAPATTSVAASAVVASPPLPVPAPRKESRLVKTTASMSSDAFFEFDKTVLTPAARSALDGVIARIKTSGFVGNLRVTGHTCDIGSAAYNQGLSERRANSVRNYLIANGGLSKDVIIAEGQGLRNPRYPNTRAERHKNRRVDLEFVTYEDKVEEFLVPVPPVAAPAPTPAPAPVVTAPPVLAPVAAPAPVEWRREVIEKEPTWLRRALRQSAPHKQTVDVYRQQEQATTVTQGDKRYINRPPVAANDAYTVAFNSTANPLDVLANDSDPDGDALTITSVGAPQHGTASITGNRLAYTPSTGYSGSDTFVYAISDGKGGSASATVTITVQGPPNRPPVAVNDVYTVDQNSNGNALNVLSNDSDPDGDALTIASVGVPGHGSATIAGNRVNYTPITGFTGSDSLSYSISDGRGGTATATVSITVQALVVNRPPVAQNDTYTVSQDSAATSLNVLANDSDPDGDTLTIATVSVPAHGTASIAGNRVNYTPAAGYAGPDSFTYSISDGKGATASATVSITITAAAPVNRPPLAQNDAFTVDQDSSGNSLNVLANDSDPDGDALTITTVSTPGHGSAAIASNRVSYTPAPGFVGTDTFTYAISDGHGGTANATVTVTVRAVVLNQPPVARDDSFFISQKFTDLDVLANDSDPDGDALTIISITQPPYGSVEITSNGKSLRYTLPFMFNRTSFTYTVSDGRGGTATATVTLIDP